jgi:hypothetical protein
VSDDDDLAEGDDNLHDDGAAAARSGTKVSGRGLDGIAMRTLRTAQRLFKQGDSSAVEANFLVAYANVLARLDLASAVRGADIDTSDDVDNRDEAPRKQRRRR